MMICSSSLCSTALTLVSITSKVCMRYSYPFCTLNVQYFRSAMCTPALKRTSVTSCPTRSTRSLILKSIIWGFHILKHSSNYSKCCSSIMTLRCSSTCTHTTLLQNVLQQGGFSPTSPVWSTSNSFMSSSTSSFMSETIYSFSS